MIDVNALIVQIEEHFDRGEGHLAEALMKENIAKAVEEQDDNALLVLLNELIGYCRETSRVEESYQLADQAVKLADRMGLAGSVPYATTLLNVANAYRAGGRLQDSLHYYQETMAVYAQNLAPEDMLVASLWNNMSLLYQEMQDYMQAKECLLKALAIVEKHPEKYFELAVTYTNLASTCLALEQDEEAREHFVRAIELFEAHQVLDAHYSAALSSLGTYHYRRGEYTRAAGYIRKAMECMKAFLGENEFYHRLRENLQECERKMVQNREGLPEKGMPAEAASQLRGMDICRMYYEEYVRPMIHEQFPAYEGKIAVGLVGEGSDCFGYDDAISRDHDWGPDVCLWITGETQEKIGDALREAYGKLPQECRTADGQITYKRAVTAQGQGRRGVMTIDAFYKRLLGEQAWEAFPNGHSLSEDFWRQASDAALAAAVNGQVFADEEGIFGGIRRMLQEGYPAQMQYRKIAQSAAMFSQTGQYNYERMLQRGDSLTAQMMLGDALREAARLCYYMENHYPPHDKWLIRGLQELPGMERVGEILDGWKIGEERALLAKLGEALADALYRRHFISDRADYLDAHTPELLWKAAHAAKTKEELVEEIVRAEFAAFDKVQNEGGRASCQDDWYTFSIMRKSQYLTWNDRMLLQYGYDFTRELSRGRNMITEKYGRMMESTAPEEYEKLKAYFPELSPEKKAIIESVVAMQVQWMEAFEAEYPTLADNARSIRTGEDNRYNTSYETYLRGELGTYSDKMLELYGRYVVETARCGRNLAYEIMGQSVKMYGYSSLAEAEERMKRLFYPSVKGG